MRKIFKPTQSRSKRRIELLFLTRLQSSAPRGARRRWAFVRALGDWLDRTRSSVLAAILSALPYFCHSMHATVKLK
jgi:hypothetical protein